MSSENDYSRQLLNLNTIISDLVKNENQLKEKISLNRNNSELLDLLLIQLDKLISTKSYLEKKKHMILRKFLNTQNMDTSSSDSDN